MTYHVRAGDSGSFELPVELVRQIGARPGDLLSIEHDGSALVIRREEETGDPLSRLRTALRGYSVDQFLAERRADTGP